MTGLHADQPGCFHERYVRLLTFERSLRNSRQNFEADRIPKLGQKHPKLTLEKTKHSTEKTKRIRRKDKTRVRKNETQFLNNH